MADDYCGNQIRTDAQDPNDIVLDSPNSIALNCGSKIPAGFEKTPSAPVLDGRDPDKKISGDSGTIT